MEKHTKDITQNHIFFSTKELREWVKAGLIQNHLLVPEKMLHLMQYILLHKDLLYRHYRDSEEEHPHYVELPTPDKWPETYELHIRDRKTGEIVKTFDLMAEFKLVDDLSLQVKAKEINEWQRDLAGIQNLTKEQSLDLKKFIDDVGPNRPLSRKEIATAIKEIQKAKKNKPQKYRQSGHLIDQKLKYEKPGSSNGIINLNDQTKRKIDESQIEIKVEGIRLTEPESKLEHALTKLLRDNSQNKNPHTDDYYKGNEQPVLVEYGSSQRTTPVIRFKRADLYKAYLCKDGYSGADAEFIDNLLMQYASKKFLIKYDHVKQTSTGETLTDRIEEVGSLIKLLQFFPNLTDEEKTKLDNGDAELREQREEVIVAFNPVFIDQIETKFVEFPDDSNRRLVIAAGGHKKVTVAMRRLMEWCMREISAKRDKSEINEDNLAHMLGLEKYVKQKRTKLIREGIKKAIDTIKTMGIITKADRVLNSKSNYKWVFHLHTKYE